MIRLLTFKVVWKPCFSTRRAIGAVGGCFHLPYLVLLSVLSLHVAFMKALDSIWENSVQKTGSQVLNVEEEQNDPCVSSLPQWP